MKKNVNNLVRLHEAMQEKLKQYYIQNKSKFLPWYLNVLFRKGGISAKPAPKKRKIYHH